MNLVTERIPVFPPEAGSGTLALPTGSHEESNQSHQAVAFFLCLFGGALGLHRIYIGKYVTGSLFLLTFGLLGCGFVYDLLMISLGMMTDTTGRPMRGEEETIILGIIAVFAALPVIAIMMYFLNHVI